LAQSLVRLPLRIPKPRGRYDAYPNDHEQQCPRAASRVLAEDSLHEDLEASGGAGQLGESPRRLGVFPNAVRV
jgi:hypothetical protein